MTRRVFGFVLASVLVACSTVTPSQQPPVQVTPTALTPIETTRPGQGGALYLENRGGPAFTVRISNTDIATVVCNGGERLTPGEGNVPQLPWDLTLVRVRDGTTILARQVTVLPQWFVQIGEEPLGLSEQVILGPGGPTCPPSD